MANSNACMWGVGTLGGHLLDARYDPVSRKGYVIEVVSRPSLSVRLCVCKQDISRKLLAEALSCFSEDH